MKRTGTALFLVLTMLCTLLGGTVSAQAAEADVWDGSTDIDWYDGGDPQDSYDISTAAQLAGLAELVNDGVENFSGATITLTADVDLNYLEWTPIGTKVRNCLEDVTFDGGGHRIHQMRITADGYYSGFFGNLNNCVI
ncbi:MAG: hypothetical protein LIO46_05625, partial [Clostridiales bacterium]|nr:hypothetical protein [Clostridiales bacterium]